MAQWWGSPRPTATTSWSGIRGPSQAAANLSLMVAAATPATPTLPHLHPLPASATNRAHGLAPPAHLPPPPTPACKHHSPRPPPRRHPARKNQNHSPHPRPRYRPPPAPAAPAARCGQSRRCCTSSGMQSSSAVLWAEAMLHPTSSSPTHPTKNATAPPLRVLHPGRRLVFATRAALTRPCPPP